MLTQQAANRGRHPRVLATGQFGGLRASGGCGLGGRTLRHRARRRGARPLKRPLRSLVRARRPVCGLGLSALGLCLLPGRLLRRRPGFGHGGFDLPRLDPRPVGVGLRRGRRLLGRRGAGTSFPGLLDHRDLGVVGYGLAFLDKDLLQDALVRRRDLRVDLVRDDLEKWLVLRDRVAGLLEPLADRPFGHALAELGHCHLGHDWISSRAVSASFAHRALHGRAPSGTGVDGTAGSAGRWPARMIRTP